MVSLSGSLQFASNANLAVLSRSSASSPVAPSSAQLKDDTFTLSGQNAQIANSGSATRFDSDSIVEEPFYTSSLQLHGSIEKSGSNTYATLEASGETAGVGYITEVSNGLMARRLRSIHSRRLLPPSTSRLPLPRVDLPIRLMPV